jgi:hypothetical protein
MLPVLSHESHRHARIRTATILAGLTVAVFAPTLSAGFVYDARLQILTDTFLHEAANWWNVLSFRVLGMDVLDFNRPVHLASLMLDAAIWGKEPFGYHLTSVLLHAVNTVLLWLVVQEVLVGDRTQSAGEHSEESLLPGQLVAVLAALLFAVHPVVVEAVCEPTFREDLLAAAFTLAAVLVAARHEMNAGADLGRAAGCAGLCLLAVASKEAGVAAPFVVAAFWWLFRGGERSRFWAIAIGGGLALVAVFLAARFLLEHSPSRIFEVRPSYPGGSLAGAMMLEPRILVLYAQLIAFPANLCADYGLHSVRHLPLWASAIVITGLAAAAAVGVRRDRRILFGLALLLLPLVPVSNLVPIYRAAADRYLYLPLAGVACIAACVLDRMTTRAPERTRQAVLIGTMAAVAALAAACVGRQAVWANQLALWEDTFQKMPISYTAANGYSGALREAGRHDEAVLLARRAIEVTGGTRGDAWLSLALALDAAGKPGEADEAMKKAIEMDGRLADPDARVAVLAMERDEAAAAKKVLARIR